VYVIENKKKQGKQVITEIITRKKNRKTRERERKKKINKTNQW